MSRCRPPHPTLRVAAGSALFLVLGGCCASQHGHNHGAHHGGHHHGGHHHGGGMPHRFEDAERWSKVFDNPERDAWQRPDEVVARVVDGREDLRLVDLGAGTGYFTLRFARALPRGQVIAADIEPSLLAKVAERASGAGLEHVMTQLGAPEDPKLEAWAGAIDLVFLCNTYHHIGNRTEYFRRVGGLLAPAGRLVVVDFRPESKRGPPPGHKIPPETLDAELVDAGYRLVDSWEGLPDQYLRIYQLRATQ